MHPDFSFFKKDGHGVIRPSLIDPHSVHLGDAMSKLKGYVKYIETPNDMTGAGMCGDAFLEIWSVTGFSDKAIGLRYIDLKDEGTREFIKAASGMSTSETIEDLYKGPLSKPYILRRG